jgi:glycosyltransferase involved in cell wall biosynthesis
VNVTLYRDLPSESWWSMERYADELAACLPRTPPSPDVISYVLPSPIRGSGRLSVLLTQAWRSTAYPLAAARRQGDINHVIDHSYAHLVHMLDQRRTVVTCHDLAPLALRPLNTRRGLSTLLWDWSFTGMLKSAHIICDSLFTAAELARLANYPVEHTTVVPLGVDRAFRPISDRNMLDTLREQYQLSPERSIILHVGHCAARKNINRLIEALGIVRRHGAAFHFVQIGGQFTLAQRDLIHRNELNGQILQILYQSKELPAWYNLANVFVFPSTYEGFGLPVLEAMACGTPVVCSRSASLPEVAGNAALYADAADAASIADALLSVLQSPVIHAELQLKGRERALAFTWQQTARQVVESYGKVIAQL